MGLLTCKQCRRHCRTAESSCPFCGARRLIARAGVITFATLGIGWTDDGGGDASAEAAAPATPNVSETPDGGLDTSRFVVAIYGTVPPPHRPGC